MINYYLLMKPGIIMGNLITVAAGFVLASKGHLNLWLFMVTMLGLGLIMASGCVFNNYIDRSLDQKMERTKNRALVTGLISGYSAISFAIVLGILGSLVLYTYTNLLTLCIALIGFMVYVLLYSFWKSHTVYATAMGSIAGAVPPVVGYCAVSDQFDAGALILFLMLVLWQMPHFYSIAMFHMDDYKAAGIPVLPIKKGMLRTKIHMVIYISCFIVTALMLNYFHYTGSLFSIVTAVLGLSWLALCLKGFKTGNNSDWGRHMFRLSLVVIMAMCLAMPF